MSTIIVIAHNLRSAHNVGALLRTAEGLGVRKVYLTGYTPYPLQTDDSRLPHLAQKIDRQITKTALGAATTISWEHVEAIAPLVTTLKEEGFSVTALEQNPQSISLPGFRVPDRIALILGREVEGVEPEILDMCDQILEIPMFGKKESFNVVQAAAMALYHFRFKPA